MKKNVIETARAKINLLLDIAGLRNDGYHCIDGIMQSVSLADLVEVVFDPSERPGIEIQVIGNQNVPNDPSNLAYRAAELYLQKTKLQGSVRILLEKHIPQAAGLAGGSADAAATLRALNRLSGVGLDLEALCALGVQIGADVPFCIRGGAMRTRGIGEELTPVPGLSDCTLVIACAQTRVSTPQAYQKLDAIYNRFSNYPNPAPKVEKLIQVLRKGDLSGACKHFENIFEIPVMQENREVGNIKMLLKQHGALRAMMSGSGPAVFGVFENAANARSACKELEGQGIFATVCQPVSAENSIC